MHGSHTPTTHHAYFSSTPRKLHTHYHDCHEILYIVKGEIELFVNGTRKTASAGNLVLFSRYENHSVSVLSEEYERYVLQIAPKAGSNQRLYALLANRPEGFQNVLNIADDPRPYDSLFLRMTWESANPGALKAHMLELLVQELLVLIYRRTPSLSASMEDEAFAYIFDLQHRFETDCSRSYSLEGLARDYNLSPSTLSHQFKKITGSSVMEYLLACRMAQAKKYLTETTMGIGEIVDRCGFSDCSNFSRSFKKRNGITPSVFRDRYHR